MQDISVEHPDHAEVIKRLARQIGNYSTNEHIWGIKESVSEIMEGDSYLPDISLSDFAEAARVSNPVAYKELMEAIKNVKS